MRLVLFTIPFLATAALAQNPPLTVSPAAAAAALGNTNNNIPFSWTPCSYQQVHSATAFSVGGPMVVGLMRLRMANGFANRPGNTVDLELFMADSPNDADNASSTFAGNVVPGTEVAVFTRKIASLPTVPDNSWAVSFPFDNAYTWNNTHVSWRAENYGNGNGNAIFTYPLDAWSNRGTYTANGTFNGCQGSNATRAAYHYSSMPGPGGTANFYGRSYDPNGGLPALLLLGLNKTNLGPFPLPFDLSVFGAPSCFLTQDLVASAASVTNANTNGDVTISVPVPQDPNLSGKVLYSQYAFIDAAANALGSFFSRGIENTIGTPYHLTRIYGLGGPGSGSGSVGTQYGMAVGFN